MFTTVNHYVPQWYQRRFLTNDIKEKKLYYLDLHPERIQHAKGCYIRKACRHLGPVNCFAQDHLYTLFFKEMASDIIEEHFFGKIDRLGAIAVGHFSDYSPFTVPRNAVTDLMRFLDAQTLRTPKGLDYIKKLTGGNTHQEVLGMMHKIYEHHITIWIEGVWEILQCDESETKFIVSDHPVTTYNKALFPLSKDCKYPFEAPIERVGTRTIFPLDANRCLVITNLEYVRDPYIRPHIVRQNPRRFSSTLFDIRKVQTGRLISENDVRNINYILKKRAKRYVAAAKKEWLYPEDYLKTTMWSKLGGKYFLMPDPRKVTFTTGMLIGHSDGSSWGVDEYGRPFGTDSTEVKAQRDRERGTFQAAKDEWDKHFGPLSADEKKQWY